MKLDDTTHTNIESWLKGDYDEASKKAVQALHGDALVDAFYKHLSFGTGGLRGIMGVGTNRMNVYTVRAATQGLANYINRLVKKGKRRVVIGYDSRHHSHEFAQQSAKVLAANNIEVFLYKDIRPVPLVSFGVLHLQATAGIMITASHNPPEYNGYKVYWSHGGQVIFPHDQEIIDEVNKIESPSQVHCTENTSLIHEVNGEVDDAYINAVRPLALHNGDNHTHGKKLHIVYTSLHGAGITMVPNTLKDWGFSNITLVEKQVIPDGDFPTVKKPNPEEKPALSLGVSTMQEVKGDILIANDPDSDRIGIVVMHDNEPYYLNGNEVACLVIEHICRSLKTSHQMPPKPMFVKTIVTSELFAAIARHYGAECLDVLTGFKYIGEKIALWEEENKRLAETHHYIFGGEESYGYLYGTHVRDKDGIISAAIIAEMALQLKLQGKTLVNFLHEIFSKYGVFANRSTSFEFEGKEGAEKMARMMGRLRDHPPEKIGNTSVITVEDYLNHQKKIFATGKTEPLLLPKSDVLLFRLSDGSKLIVRPSGTEPKIKFYCEVADKHFHPDAHSIEKALKKCYYLIDERIELLKRDCSD
ncbi:MAG: phospho-sugar mutase [Chlamydiales bacterium]|nr:phospho-sugar mutase [Chlamydiales bacterium]